MILEPFEDKFFEKIEWVIKTKGRFVAEAYYHFLAPKNKTDDQSIKKYEDLLAKVMTENSDNTFFINMLKDSISDLKVKQKGCLASAKYISTK